MKKAIWAVVAVALVSLTVILILVIGLSDAYRPETRVEYFKVYADLTEIVVVGFGAALLAILIPTIVTDARMTFERLQDSRTAYSEAKTGVDYLPIRLAASSLKSAGALLQRVHVRKHQADLFDELARHLMRRGITKSPDQWGDNIYARCFVLNRLLEKHAHEWDSLTPAMRLRLIRAVLPQRQMERLVEGAVDPGEIRFDVAQQTVQTDGPASGGSAA